MWRPSQLCAAALAFFTSIASTPIQAQPQTVNDEKPISLTSLVRFTTPNCATYSYGADVVSRSGTLLPSKPKNVYCLPHDEGSSDLASGPRAEIRSLLSEMPISGASFALWVIDDGSDNSFSSAVCNASYTADSQLRFIYNSRAPTSVSSEKTIDRIENCLQTKEHQPRILRYPLGLRNGVRSMHNKIMVVDRADGSTRLALSTGHYLFGTTIHFDSWVFIEGESSDAFFRKQRCAIETLSNNQLSLGPSYKQYFECLKLQKISRHEHLSPPEYSFFQLPYERKEFDNFFDHLVGESDEIDIAMSLFTARRFYAMFIDVARKGVRIRLILDDDHYWASQGPDWCPTCYVNHSKTRIWTQELLSLQTVQARFLETANQQCGGGNFLHKKDVVFKKNGIPIAVLTGSLNFTPGGISQNLESVYFITNMELRRAFSSEFDRLFLLGTSIDQIPSGRNPRPELPAGC